MKTLLLPNIISHFDNIYFASRLSVVDKDNTKYLSSEYLLIIVSSKYSKYLSGFHELLWHFTHSVERLPKHFINVLFLNGFAHIVLAVMV